MRVLLVDDEDMIRDLFSAILIDAEYDVTCASNGAEAVKILQDKTFDLVITDILMPEKEGVETIMELKKKTPETRIIALSGGGRTKNFMPLKIAARAGADMTLQKPIEPDDLVKAVRKVMARQPGS